MAIIFQANYTTPGNNHEYNWPIKFDDPPAFDVEYTHLPTGAYNGGPAVMTTVHAGSPGNMQDGWGIDSLTAWENFCAALVNGGSLFIRLTYSEPNNNIWGYANKFLDIGENDARTIVWQHGEPDGNLPFTLGGSSGTVNNPVDFGFDPSITTWDHATVNDKYMGFDISKGITGFGAGPILVGDAADTKPVGSGIPADGIYHFQIQITYGPSGTAAYRIWSNNNTQGSPNKSITSGFSLSVAALQASLRFFVGMTFGDEDVEVTHDVAWIIHRFVVADTFDASWYPGAQAVTPMRSIGLAGAL